MKISYYNIGCKVNFSEISYIVEQFIKDGYELVEFGEPADLILINTCTVTKNADSDNRKIIRRAIRSSPNAYIAVLGCYSELNSYEISEIQGVDAILDNFYKFRIRELITDFKKNEKVKIFKSNYKDYHFDFACSIDNESHTRIVLKIQDGCDYFCSYCAVPYARGRSRSMNFEELKDKLFELNETNYKEVVLSGINLGDYKTRDGKSFLDVVRLINAMDLGYRVRLSSIEPDLLSSELIDEIARSTRICPHFHIPLQSGSDDILKLMRRKYDAGFFKNLIFEIKNKISDACIGVDVISGFPGETEKDFEQTYELLESLPISYLHPFTYSDRKHALSYRMSDKVPHSVKKYRTKILKTLSEAKKLGFYTSQLGSVRCVLPENFHSGTNFYSGWSENYIKVYFKLPQINGVFPSEIFKVKLNRLLDGNVLGEIV